MARDEQTPASEAIDEAVRTIAKTSQHAETTARGALTDVTPLVTETLATNRKLLQAWATGIEASVKAGFEVRRALLMAIPPFADASFGAGKGAFEEWKGVMEKQDKVLLDSLHRAVERMDTVLAGKSAK